jgi:hypothetical protein
MTCYECGWHVHTCTSVKSYQTSVEGELIGSKTN